MSNREIPVVPESPVLRGMARFEIKGQLGAGGMGVVYEAYDKEKDSVVALKTLKRLSPQSLLLFKNEFRSLTNLHHPNLIRLYELFSEEDLWFFSMELLSGQDLISFIRSLPPPSLTPTLAAPTVFEGLIQGSQPLAPLAPPRTTEVSDHVLEHTAVGFPAGKVEPLTAQIPPQNDRPSPDQAGFEEGRLRHALMQLTRGISALHAAGKIHRDIKPSNVMVTQEGRVVLMDFGLIREVSAEDVRPNVVGTPYYMSPEQAMGRGVGTESDWYALGVILYQALTGQLPFSGSLHEILLGKQERDPTPPKTLCPNLPEDLEALCMALLSRMPAKRPKGEEILQCLDPGLVGGFQASRSVVLPAVSLSSTFVGREEELTRLRELYEESQQKREGLSVFVHGESGLGKSALIQKFLASLPSPMVLSGRCYEQESVPYKALDGIIDGLSHYLAKLEPREAALLLPGDAALLARVFPVLRQVRAIDGVVPSELQDPFELRRRVFSALRELFTKLSARVPLVLFIDDLQWTDNDSLLLLSDLLRPPLAPSLFLIASVRGGGPQDPTIKALIAKLESVSIQHMKLSGLSPVEVSALVGLLRVGADVDAHWSQETGGHPLFIQEMARYARPQGSDATPTKLDDILLARINRIEEESRRLLELTAVSGAPLPQRLLAQAAGLSVASFYQSVLSLRAGQLVRTGGMGEHDPIEPYHDRVRETLVAHLNPATRQGHHRKLAEVLEGAAYQDPQALMRHWEGAVEPVRAAVYAIQAADLARTSMAFERAAELYRDALRLGQYPKEEERRLRYLLGESLSYAGKGKEAADAFLAAAEGASQAERLKCRTQAMRQLLSGGYIEDGLNTARTLLQEIGGRWPETNAETIVTLLWHRAALRLRGLHWSERKESDIPLEKLLPLDVYEYLATGLATVDTYRGALFQTIWLRRALELGEAARMVHGLAAYANFIAAEGVRHYPRAWALATEVRNQAEARGDPTLLAWASLCAGGVSFCMGRFQESLPLSKDAERRFVEQVPGSNAELNLAVNFRLNNLHVMGYFRDLARLVPEYLQDAVRRGDRYTKTSMLLGFNVVWLRLDDPTEVCRWLERAAWSPPEGTYHMQDAWEFRARTELALYEGTGLSPELESSYRAFFRSLLTRYEFMRAHSYFMWGSLLLMEARKRGVRMFLREVEQMVKGLYKIPAEYTRTWGLLLEAGLARLRNNPTQAIGFFRRATQAAEASGLQMEAAVSRLRQGEIIGGEEGRSLISQANEYMTREGIKNPARFSQLYSPWLE